jgi:hypothetical protein
VDLFGDREWSYQLAEGGPITWPPTGLSPHLELIDEKVVVGQGGGEDLEANLGAVCAAGPHRLGTRALDERALA